MNLRKIKNRLYIIIFEADTFGGKLFDLVLLFLILISILAVMLESVKSVYIKYGSILRDIEWAVTILFTIEYFLRIWISEHKLRYIFSFYGIIDFLAVLPSYISIFLGSANAFIMIRTLRLLRIFRILQMGQYISESNKILKALKAGRTKIMVFLYFILILVIIIGTIMYLVEGEKNGFTSIPRAIYWAIVTITTVGYGDIAPQTTAGQIIAGILMVVGYSIIAVPTGIVSAEFSKNKKNTGNLKCQKCGHDNHDNDAKYCKYCGNKLEV